METGKIYKISNNFDEKLYIGQTWYDIEKRFKQHCMTRNGCLKLRNSIQAHGKENFTTELLWEGECTQAELDKKEVEFISSLKSLHPLGYNLTEGGMGGRPSDETRAKMSKAGKGRVATEATRAKMSAALKGRGVTKETRAKLSASLKTEEARAKTRAAKKGNVVSEETREKHRVAATNPSLETRAKLSAAAKARTISEETRRKMNDAHAKPVEQWSRDGKIFIKMFESISFAARSTGVNYGGICNNSSGRNKTAGGFVWRRVKEKESVLINDEPVC